MKATMLYGPKDVRFEERPDPVIMQPTDAIIRVSVACVCGSDLWPYRGAQSINGPTPMGHEYCGIVEEVGREVRTIRRGQFVVGSFATSDNTCPHCRHGYQSSCVQRQFMSEAQAPLLRVPLADGTLVATNEVPSDDLLPRSAHHVGRPWHRLVRCRGGERQARCDGRRRRRRRRRVAGRALSEARGRRTHHRDEPPCLAPGARA